MFNKLSNFAHKKQATLRIICSVLAVGYDAEYNPRKEDYIIEKHSNVTDKLLSLGIDDEWRSTIFAEYEVLGSPEIAEFLQINTVPDEVKQYLQPNRTELLLWMQRDIQHASELRREILQKEDLWAIDKVVSVMSSTSLEINEGDVVAMESEGLILALRDHGQLLIPSFQFGEQSGKPHPAIVSVNRIFGASSPWSRLAWWRQTNRTLGAAPKDMLHERSSEEIVQAAIDSLKLG